VRFFNISEGKIPNYEWIFMQEIIIPEILTGFFITVSLLRPFIKKLWDQEGLIWFPFLALGVVAALFPAYGFRPECIPLLIYGFFYAVFNLPLLFSFLNHSHNKDFWGQSHAFRIVLLVLFIPVLGIALFFAPAPAPDPALPETGVASVMLIDEQRGERLFLQIYNARDDEEARRRTGGRRPLLIVIPPVSGSIPVIGQVCRELRDAGFTVLTYSRQGFDSPAIGPDGKAYGLSLNKRLRLFRAEARGRTIVAANLLGRSLEEGRRQDILFLLDMIGENTPLPVSEAYIPVIEAIPARTDLRAVFLVGYDAGGSALLDLAGSPDFTARYPAVKGVIAVESPLFSVLTGEELPPAPPPNDNWFIAVWSGIRSRAAALRKRRITGIGEVPLPNVPVCLILSDKVANPRYREDRYAAILKVFRSAAGPAVLTAAVGAGPLDYSDVPVKFPLYSVLRPGNGKAPRILGALRGTHRPGETAALMTNFAAAVLEEEEDGRREPALARKLLPPQRFHVEANNRWNSLKNGSIL
jgi:dienelactone hydrolase